MQPNEGLSTFESLRRPIVRVAPFGYLGLWTVFWLIILRWEVAIAYFLYRLTSLLIFRIQVRIIGKSAWYDCTFWDGPMVYVDRMTDRQILATSLSRIWLLLGYAHIVGLIGLAAGNGYLQAAGVFLALNLATGLLPLASHLGGKIISKFATGLGAVDAWIYSEGDDSGKDEITIERRYVFMVLGWLMIMVLAYFINDGLARALLVGLAILDLVNTIRDNSFSVQPLARREVPFWAGVYLLSLVAFGFYTWQSFHGQGLWQVIWAILSDASHTLIQPFLPFQ